MIYYYINDLSVNRHLQLGIIVATGNLRHNLPSIISIVFFFLYFIVVSHYVLNNSLSTTYVHEHNNMTVINGMIE